MGKVNDDLYKCVYEYWMRWEIPKIFEKMPLDCIIVWVS